MTYIGFDVAILIMILSDIGLCENKILLSILIWTLKLKLKSKQKYEIKKFEFLKGFLFLHAYI